MSEAERRALRRATVLLLSVSLARWAWAERAQPVTPREPDELPVLLEASERRAQDAAARSAPLALDEVIDPNHATEQDLDRLPGVGPATARAIVEERERGGAFGALEDLLRVRGVGEETLARISEHLDMSDAPRPGRRGTGRDRPVRDPPALDVNTADRDALQRLPGIGPALADRIVEARRRRPFRTLDELTRVTGIGPATVERLRGHASVGPVGR